MAKAGGIAICMGKNSQRPALLQEDGRGELAGPLPPSVP